MDSVLEDAEYSGLGEFRGRLESRLGRSLV